MKELKLEDLFNTNVEEIPNDDNKFLMIIIGGEIKMCKASDAYNHKKYISAWAIEPDFIVFK